jgi:integrase
LKPCPVADLPKPFSDAFKNAYAAAVAGEQPQASPVIGADRTKSGSVKAAFVIYRSSARFAELAPSTQTAHDRLLGHWVDDCGWCKIQDLRPQDVAVFVDDKAKTAPASAREFLKAVRRMMQHLEAIGLIPKGTDPTKGVEVARPKRSESALHDGIHTMTEPEIETFEAVFPALSSTPRLVSELGLATAQRVSDLWRMGPMDLRKTRSGGRGIFVRQRKTGWSGLIPISDELARYLASLPADRPFIVKSNGEPFKSAKSLAEEFKKWCRKADLLHCSVHGLRKAACRRLAEAGCSPSQIMEISGHRTLSEVQRYTKHVDQELMAEAAVSKSRTAIVKPAFRSDKGGS